MAKNELTYFKVAAVSDYAFKISKIASKISNREKSSSSCVDIARAWLLVPKVVFKSGPLLVLVGLFVSDL